MPPPVRKLSLEDNSILQRSGGIGAFRDAANIEEMKRGVENLTTLANIRELGSAGAADLQQYGYMLLELPDWLSKLLYPYAIDRYISDAGGHNCMVALNGKRLLARAEPLDNTKRFDEAASGLASVARLVATALLGHRQNDILTPSAIDMLRPVDGQYRHASVAHINVYTQDDDDAANEQGAAKGASVYAPHVDAGLLTLVTCPVADRCLVVRRPGDGEREHVPLEPGLAAVIPGLSLCMDPQACTISTFAIPYAATKHHVDRATLTSRQRASITFHLRPHPDVTLSSRQTAGDFLERFYSSVDRVNAPPAALPAPAGAPAAAAHERAAAGAGAAAGAPPAAAAQKIDVRVSLMDGREIWFKINPQARVSKLMGAVSQVAGISVDTMRVVIDGYCLSENEPFTRYGVQDGDTIHIFTRQTGD